jgi:hypothetical protein
MKRGNLVFQDHGPYEWLANTTMVKPLGAPSGRLQ